MGLVKAIEHPIGQTESLDESQGRCGVWPVYTADRELEVPLERATREGESPVEVTGRGDFQDPRVGCIGYCARIWEALTSNPKYVPRPIAH